MDLTDAWLIACTAHEGQVDKSGDPYRWHVARVMARFSLDDVDAKMTAAFHDVVEDSAMTLDDLRAAGCPDVVLAAVGAITKRKGEDYSQFLQRVSTNPLALRVKAADLCDNSDEKRLAKLPNDAADRLRTKYAGAINELGVSEQIAEWRKADLIGSATIESVIDGGGRGFEPSIAQADATFQCLGCDGIAARLTVQGDSLLVIGFGGSTRHLIPEGLLDRVCESVLGDLKSLRTIDPEYAPFWCAQCEAVWCWDHWETTVVMDDGFYDATYGRCPVGHRQELDD